MKCTASGCSLYRSTNVLLLDTTSNLNFIYRCDANARCVLLNNLESPGLYVAGFPTSMQYPELIKCEDKDINKCIVKELPSAAEGTVYYIDREHPGNIITCTDDYCETSPGIEGVGYLDEEKKEESYYQYVITCKNDVCTSENKAKIIADNANISKLIFIDNSDSTKIITCEYNYTAEKIICKIGPATANQKYINGIDPNSTITCNGSNICSSAKECRVTTGVNCNYKKYYLVKDKTNYFIGDSTTTNGLLYYCEKSTTSASAIQCSQITEPGYYINYENQYFTCDKNNNCKEANTLGTCSLTSTDTGKIFIDNNLKIALCLDGTKSVPLNSLVRNYLLSYDATVNLFGLLNQHYALIRSNENSFTQDTNFNFTNDYFTYINPTTQEVLVEEEGCPDNCYDSSNPGIANNPDPNLIKEYKCADGKPDCVVVVPPASP